ncbi:3-oxoacyl-[acyl-carrier-protein] synthase-3 [Desulfosalsimonas propionicica]|uniref:3-oxoacyl-[acyl-carrier-protein] synthase-3 n=1 Tax=Desulfosalsimonas propionicica TaxID=332175 RepID=A0A7W0C8R9_9BACT|nr:ketoacyl-ACP synthase III [Desulfosalsimonas propionicica]MBA2881263.1 3-oxoacyl-[acyl-carrier-protein] synthase-3 [Desulfosalsimonas propionicica]
MLYLHGLGHFYPDNVIDNQFLRDLDIGSDEQWILERVGIAARRTSLPLDYIRQTKNRDPRAATEASLYTRAGAGASAAQMALDRAGIGTEDIGMVISGTSTPRYTIPAEASVIAAEIGIDAPCMDMNAACSTFLVQLAFLDAMAPGKAPGFILVVNPENYTHVVDYSDRRVAPLFGDGTSAAVVSARHPSCYCFESLQYGSDPASWDRVQIPSGGHFQQDGSQVQRFAIRKATEGVRRLQDEYPENRDQFRFVGHQANLMMLQTVCRRCGIDEARNLHNVVEYGNTGCSSAPAVLSQNWEDLQPGDHIAVAVVGSGLTWGHGMLSVKDAE